MVFPVPISGSRLACFAILVWICGTAATAEEPMNSVSTEPIVVSQTIAAPIGEMWKAITDRNRMVQWFFREIAGFRPEVGFETRFAVHVEGRDFVQGSLKKYLERN